jgi:phosphate transport system substrate-binding protein
LHITTERSTLIPVPTPGTPGLEDLMPSLTPRLALGIVLFTLACGGSDRPSPGSGGDRAPRRGAGLTGAGATFPNPIYTKWFDAYAKETGVRINYQSIGSGGGIRQFTEGTVDFGATDGPMTDEQIAAVQGNVMHIPTVIGAVVLTYNLPSLGATKLRFDSAAIADIYLGRLTKWNDPRLARLNPRVKLPDRDIIVVHRSDGSGTTYVFVDYLSKVSTEWGKKVGKATSVNWPVGLGGKGNEGVTQQVKQTEGAIGYVELIYAISNQLPYATVKNAAGKDVDATLATATAAAAGIDLPPDTDFRVSITDAQGADAYPISSFTWLLIRKEDSDSARARSIRDFAVWMLQPAGQRMAADLHYAPLPVPIIELVQRRLGLAADAASP